MLRFWRKLLQNAGKVNAFLARHWNNDKTRNRTISICTLLLTSGLAYQQLLHPYLQKKAVKCSRGSGMHKLDAKCRSVATYSHRDTFRDVKIKEYENRLRAHSGPEKVFGYFATIMTTNTAGQWEVFMTPADFLRSMLPGIRQPEGLGLHRYRKMSRKRVGELKFHSVPEDSIFYTLRPDGLLNFSDYLYLCALMPLPERFFEIGFRIFDPMDGTNLTIDGFNQLMLGVTKVERSKTSNSINHYFFGPQLDGKLSLNTFLKFKRKLLQDVLLIEFNMLRKSDVYWKRNEPESQTISEISFAHLLLSYSTKPTYQKLGTIRRIKEKYKQSTRGVTLDEFMAFFKFVQHIPIIDLALTFHFLAGADISKNTLKHISDIVVGVSLTWHMIDIIFTVFDTDNNDILGRQEFLQAVRHRLARKRTTKLSTIVDIITKCASRTLLP